MVSTRKSARSHVLKGKTSGITPFSSAPCTRSVTRKLFASPLGASTPSADCSHAVLNCLLDLSKQFSQLEQFIKDSTKDFSHRLSQLEHCLHRIPDHMLTPLIHISSSDDDSDFSSASVPPLSPTPANVPEDDPDEDPAEDDRYWVTDNESFSKHG